MIQNSVFNDMRYVKGDSIFFQEKDKKGWLGPVKVIAHKGRDVFIMVNGNIRKVADCKVQPYKRFEDKKEDVKESDSGESDEKEKSVTRSDTKRKELEKDSMGIFCMNVDQKECYNNEITILRVEVPVKVHKKVEVV